MSYTGDGNSHIKVLLPFASTSGGGGDPPDPPMDLAGTDYNYVHTEPIADASWNIFFENYHDEWVSEHGEGKIPVVRVWVDAGLGAPDTYVEVYPDITLDMANKHCAIFFTQPYAGYATLN